MQACVLLHAVSPPHAIIPAFLDPRPRYAEYIGVLQYNNGVQNKFGACARLLDLFLLLESLCSVLLPCCHLEFTCDRLVSRACCARSWRSTSARGTWTRRSGGTMPWRCRATRTSPPPSGGTPTSWCTACWRRPCSRAASRPPRSSRRSRAQQRSHSGSQSSRQQDSFRQRRRRGIAVSVVRHCSRSGRCSRSSRGCLKVPPRPQSEHTSCTLLCSELSCGRYGSRFAGGAHCLGRLMPGRAAILLQAAQPRGGVGHCAALQRHQEQRKGSAGECPCARAASQCTGVPSAKQL